MENISLNRINKLREACADAEIDAFFVRETSNVQWLSAFDGVFDEESAHAMLVHRRRCDAAHRLALFRSLPRKRRAFMAVWWK